MGSERKRAAGSPPGGAPVVDESPLIQGCIAGEADAWHRLVGETLPGVHSMALRVLGDAALSEDVAQAVYLKLWEDDRRRLRGFAGRARLTTWVVAIARREALDRLRREQALGRALAARAQVATAAEQALLDGSAAAGPLGREARERVREALARLEERERLLLEWVIVDRLSYAEVASLLQAPENSVGPWLSRARARFQDALEQGTTG